LLFLLFFRCNLSKRLVLKNLQLHQTNQDEKTPERYPEENDGNSYGFEIFSTFGHNDCD
jgi:hypothetical protein